MCRRQQTIRACRALFWAVCLVSAIQVASGLALEVGPIEAIDAEYGQRERLLLDRLAERPDRPLVLALGSSRTILGLQARRLSESLSDPEATVFNFGLTGAGPLGQQRALHRLQARGVRPDAVLIEVLPPLFNEPGGPTIEALWCKGEHLRAGEVATTGLRHPRPKRLVAAWARSRLLPTDHKRQLVRGGLGLELPCDFGPALIPDGYGWLSKNFTLEGEDRNRLLEHAHSQYSQAFGNFTPADAPTRTLREVLAECRRQGIPTALYLMPEASSFRAFYPPQQIRDFNAFLSRFAQEEKVPLIDAREWVSDDGFWDGHHLLPEGATVFTGRFEREAVRPLLERFRRAHGDGQVNSPAQTGGSLAPT